jgi:hypothetical protein
VGQLTVLDPRSGNHARLVYCRAIANYNKGDFEKISLTQTLGLCHDGCSLFVVDILDILFCLCRIVACHIRPGYGGRLANLAKKRFANGQQR